MDAAARLDVRMILVDAAQDVADQRHRRKVIDAEHLRPQPVVDVVRVVGDVVGDRARLRLGARIAPQLEIVGAAIFGDAARQVAFAVPLDRAAVRSVSGPLCFTSPSSVSKVRLRPSKLG